MVQLLRLVLVWSGAPHWLKHVPALLPGAARQVAQQRQFWSPMHAEYCEQQLAFAHVAHASSLLEGVQAALPVVPLLPDEPVLPLVDVPVAMVPVVPVVDVPVVVVPVVVVDEVVPVVPVVVVPPVPAHSLLHAFCVQVAMLMVAPSMLPQVPEQLLKSPPPAKHSTQQRQVASASQALRSEQQFCLLHATQAPSLVEGAQAPPLVPVLPELPEPPVVAGQLAWVHWPRSSVVWSGVPQVPKQAVGSLPAATQPA